MKNKLPLLMSIGIVSLMFGCATPTSVKPQVEPVVKVNHFNKNHWRVDGRLALRYPECYGKRGCQEQAANASLEWEHNGKTEKMVLFDPLGQEHMRIEYVGTHQVRIVENHKERVVSLTNLTKEVGVPLPIAKLADWVTTPRREESFTADGWKIQVSEWTGAYYARIKLTQKDYFLHLLIKNMFVY